jgi:hypothetical protein
MFASTWIARLLCLGLLATAEPALADAILDLPARKAGCWEHTVVAGPYGASDLDGSTYECVGDAHEQARLQAVMPESGAANCTQTVVTVPGAVVAWETTCKDGGETARIRVEAKGDFQSAYALTIVTRSGRSGKPVRQSRVKARARWVSGACPAGLAPGGWLIMGGAACQADPVSN